MLVFSGPQSQEATRKVAGLSPVVSASDLRLYRVPSAVHVPRFARTPASPVVAGDAVAIAVVGAAVVGSVAVALRRRRARIREPNGEASAMLAPRS